MSNPLLIPAPLNRVRANLTIPSFPALNVTAPYLTEEGISVNFTGEVTTVLRGMISTINSEEPYILAEMQVNLIKTLALATLWLDQIESSSIVGNVVMQSDAVNFRAITLYNSTILNVGEVSMAGKQANLQVTIAGFWAINNDLFLPV